jgi:hypothetical protein
MEIERRLAVLQCVERLCRERSNVDESELHLLVTRERWLFGPEFDCIDYAMSARLRDAVEKVFEMRDGRLNDAMEGRNDLFWFSDATCSVVSMDPFAVGWAPVPTARDLLLMELKSGREQIDWERVRAVEEWATPISTLFTSGEIACTALVVGHTMTRRVRGDASIGQGTDMVRRRLSVTYEQVIHAAKHRLWGLQDRIGRDVHPKVPTTAISF